MGPEPEPWWGCLERGRGDSLGCIWRVRGMRRVMGIDLGWDA